MSETFHLDSKRSVLISHKGTEQIEKSACLKFNLIKPIWLCLRKIYSKTRKCANSLSNISQNVTFKWLGIVVVAAFCFKRLLDWELNIMIWNSKNMPGPFTKLRSNTKCAFPLKYHHTCCSTSIHETSVFWGTNDNLN